MVLTEFSVPNAFYDNLMKAVPEEIHWNYSGIHPVLYIYEPTRHEPVSRAEPACPVLNRFLSCFCKKLQFFGLKKIIIAQKHDVNRFTP